MPTGRTRNRRKGQGSLYKQGNIYIARWMVAGKVYKRSTGETTLRAAQAKLASFTAPFAARSEAERLEAIAARAAGARAEAQRAADALPQMPLSALWDAFARSPRRRPCAEVTLGHYRSQVARFVRFVAAMRPDIVEVRQVDADTATAFLSSLSGLSPNAYNKHLNLLSLVWRTVGAAAHCTVNPWQGLARRRLSTHSRRSLSESELAAVFDAADALAPDTGLLFRIGAFTGLRLGDCCRLDWSAVDLDALVIRLAPNKTRHSTGAVVAIPIMPPLQAALAATPPGKRHGPVLPRIAALYKRDSACLAARVTRPVFDAAGIKTQGDAEGQSRRAVEVGFHSLRHTFVTRCALAGVPLPVVRAIVGHSTVAMTEHYAHSNLDAARSALSRAFPVQDGKMPEPPPARGLERALDALAGLSGAELSAVIARAQAMLAEAR